MDGGFLGIVERWIDDCDIAELKRFEKVVLSVARTLSIVGIPASIAAPFIFLQLFHSRLSAVFGDASLGKIMLIFDVFLVPGAGLTVYLSGFLRQSLAINLKTKQLRLLAAQDDRPPILVLRSFGEGDLWNVKSPYRGKGAPLYVKHYLADLARAATPLGQVVAIGDPNATGAREKFGQEIGLSASAFIPLDILFVPSSLLDWRAKFTDLASVAKAIVLIPGTTPGVLEEAGIVLANGWSEKTLVFMPPSATDAYFKSWDQNRLCEKWAVIQEHWGRGGLALPNYDAAGMLYIPNPDFSVSKCAPIGSIADSTALQKSIALLFPHLKGRTTPLRNVVQSLL